MTSRPSRAFSGKGLPAIRLGGQIVKELGQNE